MLNPRGGFMQRQDKPFTVKRLVIDAPLSIPVSSSEESKTEFPHSWLKRENDDLNAALSQLSTSEASLSMLVDSDEDSYYTNAVLRKRIDKEDFGNKLLAQLITAKEHFKKIMVQNRLLAEQQQADNVAMEIELKRLKEQLIQDLIAWRKKQPGYRLMMAKEIFENIKVTAQGDNDKIMEAMEPFHDVISLMVGDDGSFSSIAPKHPEAKQERDLASRRIPLAPEELRAKTTSQLKVLASLTNDKMLEDSANGLDRQQHLFEESREHFIKHGPKELQSIDKDFVQKLDTQTKNLAREYLIVAQQLSKESHETYDAIMRDNWEVRKEIKKNLNTLKVAENNFIVALKRHKKTPIEENAINLITRYAEFEAVTQRVEPKIGNLCEQSDKIVKRYQDAKDKFGVCPEERFRKAQRQTNKLNRVFTEAEDDLRYYYGEVKDLELKLIKKSIIQLIRGAVENNLDFWHKQVSKIFGSKAKINGVTVPQGIASIYSILGSYDPKRNNEDEVLEQIYNVINKRLEHGKGFFARRTLETTNGFYKVMQDNINIKKLHEISADALRNIRAEARKMRDSKGNRLVKLDVVPKVVDGETLEMPMSEFLSDDNKANKHNPLEQGA